MGAAARGLAYVAGTLLAVGGGAMAAYVGPDDSLEVGSHTVPEAATGLAVATHPAITQFVGINMLVRAEASSGVWVGSSHRVDTGSLLDGVRHYEISRLALRSVGGRMVEGDEAGTRRALRTQRIVGWQDQAYGGADAGVAEVVVPLDGTPTDVVAVPDRRDERVTLTIGVHWEGLFRIQLAVAGIGLLLIALGVFLSGRAKRTPPARRTGRRARRRATAQGPRSAAPAAHDTGIGTDTDTESTTEIPVVPAAPEHPRSWARSVAPTLAAVAVPATPPVRAPAGSPLVGRRLPTVIALPLTLVMLMVVSGCTLPGPASAPSDSDPAERLALTLPEAGQLVDDPVSVHADEFGDYPMWAVVELGEPSRLRLLTRESFRTRWRPAGTVRVREAPSPVSPPRTPGAQITSQAQRAVAAVSEFWSTGVAPGTRVDRRTRRAHAALLESGVDVATMWVVTDASYVVEVSGGWLVLATHTLMTPVEHSLTTAVLLSDKRPRVLGSRLRER